MKRPLPNRWQHAVNIPPLRWTPTGLRRMETAPELPILLSSKRRKPRGLILLDLTLTLLALGGLVALAILCNAARAPLPIAQATPARLAQPSPGPDCWW